MALSPLLIRIVGDSSSATTALQKLNQDIATSRRNFQRDFGEIARIARANALAISAGVGAAGFAVTRLVRDAHRELDAFRASQRTLAATAQLSGVPLETLASLADQARRNFQFGTVTANSFTTEIVKLTAKAGDIRLAGDALRAFVEVGAARGLTAQKTLEALRQAILGIDEGTDKLFGANPSVIYQEFADAIGTTVGRLTDQQKALALVNRALQDGERVRGAYAEFLRSAAGQQQLLTEQTASFRIELAKAIEPARIELLRFLRETVADLTAELAKPETQRELREYAEAFRVIAETALKAANAIRFLGRVGILRRPGQFQHVRLLTPEELAARGGFVGGAGRSFGGPDTPAPRATGAPTTTTVPATPATATTVAPAIHPAVGELVDSLRAGARRIRQAALDLRLAPGPGRVVPDTAALSGFTPAPVPPRELAPVEFRELPVPTEVERAREFLESAAAAGVTRADQLLPELRQEFEQAIEVMRRHRKAEEELARAIEGARVDIQSVLGAVGIAANAAVGLVRGTTTPLGAAGSLAGAAAGLFSGPLGVALGAASIGLGVADALFGRDSREREEEMFRAHLRALRQAAEEQIIDVTIVLPDTLDPQNPLVQERLGETVEAIARGRKTRVRFESRAGAGRF